MSLESKSGLCRANLKSDILVHKVDKREKDAVWEAATVLSLHSTVRWEVEQRCNWLLGRRKTLWPLSDHVVVVVPLNDVRRREQLLLDGGGRGRGWLHPGLEQVWYIEHLVDTKREDQVRKKSKQKNSQCLLFVLRLAALTVLCK